MRDNLYFLKQAWENVRKHLLQTFAAAGAIAAALLLIGMFTLLYINITANVKNIQQANSFIAYIADDVNEVEAQYMQPTLEAIPNVKTVTFISRTEAMKQFADYMDDPLFNELPEEVLRHRYTIEVSDIKKIQETIQRTALVNGVARVSASLEVAEGSLAIANTITAITFAVAVILVTISFFSISNTVKMAANSRRKEIEIMRMCGVSNKYISAPFFCEGGMIGFGGAISSFALLAVCYNSILSFMERSNADVLIQFAPFKNYAFLTLAVFLLGGVAMGIFSSVISTKKYLHI